jgi:hypothetical protein
MDTAAIEYSKVAGQRDELLTALEALSAAVTPENVTGMESKAE